MLLQSTQWKGKGYREYKIDSSSRVAEGAEAPKILGKLKILLKIRSIYEYFCRN